MVTLAQVQASNALITTSTAPRIALFHGGTSGIGFSALTSLSNLGLPFKAYVIGRAASASRFKESSDGLVKKNPKTEVVWIEGETSLLSEVKRICEEIKKREERIDLLFMSAGHAPLGGKTLTEEGVDTSQSLNLYTRILLTLSLLPLLLRSPSPRVLTVFAGGMEHSLPLSWLDTCDLNLQYANPWLFPLSQMYMGIMSTLALEHISQMSGNEKVTFIHSHPGFVRTGNVYRGFKPGSWGPWIAGLTLDPMMMILGFSAAESAERYLYQATSGAFGGEGVECETGVKGTNTMDGTRGGLWLVSKTCDIVNNDKKMPSLREKAGDAVWENVQEWLGPYLQGAAEDEDE